MGCSGCSYTLSHTGTVNDQQGLGPELLVAVWDRACRTNQCGSIHVFLWHCWDNACPKSRVIIKKKKSLYKSQQLLLLPWNFMFQPVCFIPFAILTDSAEPCSLYCRGQLLVRLFPAGIWTESFLSSWTLTFSPLIQQKCAVSRDPLWAQGDGHPWKTKCISRWEVHWVCQCGGWASCMLIIYLWLLIY